MTVLAARAEPRAITRPSHRFIMLRQIAGMIEMAGLQLGAADRDLGKGGFRENLFRDIVDRNIRDFMNKANILYSPETTRATTSHRVISGSMMASRPRRP
jgi:hypothetical protein